MKRRRFIGGIGAGVAALAVGVWRAVVWRRDAGAGAGGEAPTSGSEAAPVVHARFPERYRANLRAMSERLMPDEEGAPGAATADAWEFIDRELARSAAEMAGTQRLLMRGAAQLDRVAHDVAGTPFVAAPPAQRDEVIAAMQHGAGEVELFDPAVFVSAMVGLTLEGMFSDPVWGGNRDGAGWRLIGYAMHPPRPAATKP